MSFNSLVILETFVLYAKMIEIEEENIRMGVGVGKKSQ